MSHSATKSQSGACLAPPNALRRGLRLQALVPQNCLASNDVGNERIDGTLASLAIHCDITYEPPGSQLSSEARDEYLQAYALAVPVDHRQHHGRITILDATCGLQSLKICKQCTNCRCELLHFATVDVPVYTVACLHAHTAPLGRDLRTRCGVPTFPNVSRQHNIEYVLLSRFAGSLSLTPRFEATTFAWSTLTEEHSISEQADAVALLTSHDLAAPMRSIRPATQCWAGIGCAYQPQRGLCAAR